MAIVAGGPALAGEEGGIPVDVAAFQGADASGITDFSGLIKPVGLLQGDDGTIERFYVAPIVGPSWGQLLVQDQLFANGRLFAAGGAAGVAITRPLGQLRIEGEGRYRDGFGGPLGPINAVATDNWSSLANIWRDFGITDSLGAYGGGGIGAGGYRFNYTAVGNEFINKQNTTFAWQVGTGAIYAVSDRVTLDLGYRYYSLCPVESCGCGGTGDVMTQFVANELLLAVRIYEPFRRWR